MGVREHVGERKGRAFIGRVVEDKAQYGARGAKKPEINEATIVVAELLPRGRVASGRPGQVPVSLDDSQLGVT